MATHEALLTKFFNMYLAGVGNALLALFGQTADNVKEPWADHIVMQLLVAVIILTMLVLVKKSLSVDKPGKLQHMFEILHGFVGGMADDQVGHDGHKHTAVFTTLFLFVMLANVIGVIPMFTSATGVPMVPLGCALVAFLYYNIVGIRKNGFLKYSKHFMGPVWWLVPLMIPIEIISHIARPMSLTIRLWANMYAGEMVTLIFLNLTYFLFPVVFMGLHVFVALLQGYVFMLLTMIYVGGALAEEH